MEKFKLKNGITVVYDKMDTDSVTILVEVKTGSNNEKEGEAGMSHFLEHMIFEGTKKRPNSFLITSEIENLGGEMNAMTSNERTTYYVKVLGRDFEKGLEILSDMIFNSVFNPKFIEKEKKVVLNEIDMINDEPRMYQWIFFLRNLFKKIKTKDPVYGTKEIVQKFTQKDIMEYYEKYYVPRNMIISIAGNVDDINIIEKYFDKEFGEKIVDVECVEEGVSDSSEEHKEKRDVSQNYIVMGYKTVPRNHLDSYALDVVEALLGKGMSGRLVEEIRNKLGLTYSIGVHTEMQCKFGYFAIYLCTDKKNVEKVKKLIMEEIDKLEKLEEKELQEAKGYLEGTHILEQEETQKRAEKLAYWEHIDSVERASEYVDKIKKVSLEDVKRVSKKYLTKNYTMVIVGN